MLDHGATGEGDDTDAIQATLNEHLDVLLPAGWTFQARDLELRARQRLVIDGTLQMVPKTPGWANLLWAKGEQGIRIIVNGKLDGCRGSQPDGARHQLVFLDVCDHAYLYVREATGNKWDGDLAPSGAAIRVRYSDWVEVDYAYLHDWGREGLWLERCGYSHVGTVFAKSAGVDGWSGLQYSGDYNALGTAIVIDAGASSLSFDCRYSTADALIGIYNQYHASINFGHDGIPSDGSIIGKVVSIGAKEAGINFGFSSRNVRLNSFYVDGFGKDGEEKVSTSGVNVSNGATDIHLANGIVRNCGGVGLKLYNARVAASDCDFSDGNVAGPFLRLGTSVEHFSNVLLDSSVPLGIHWESMAWRAQKTINDPNMTKTMLPIMSPSSAAGAQAGLYVKSVNDGKFVVATATGNSAGGGAGFRYQLP